MRMFVSLAAVAAVSAALSVGATTAEAATVQVTYAANENVCGAKGAFSDPDVPGFSGCTVNGSPSIAKFDEEEKKWEFNSKFPLLTEHDFKIDGSDQPGWTWDYFATDPVIRYWAVKQGDGFELHWEVDSVHTDFGGDCFANVFQLNCLDKAQPLTTGSWSGDYSNITWFDTGATVIPLPAGLVLFLSGLAGIGVLGRYKASGGRLQSPECGTAKKIQLPTAVGS